MNHYPVGFLTSGKAEIRIREQAIEELNEALAADAVDAKNYHILETLSLFH